jgi:hypothetical protein
MPQDVTSLGGFHSAGSDEAQDGDLDEPATRFGAKPRHARFAAALIVVLGGVACFVPAVVHSLQTTAALNSSKNVRASTNAYRQVSCYRTTMQRTVPKGAKVYLGPLSGNEQLLVEASVTWADVVIEPTEAQFVVSLAPGPGECEGIRLVVSRRS